MLWSLGWGVSGTRSATGTPKSSRLLTLSGLLVISRTLSIFRSRRIWVAVP